MKSKVRYRRSSTANYPHLLWWHLVNPFNDLLVRAASWIAPKPYSSVINTVVDLLSSNSLILDLLCLRMWKGGRLWTLGELWVKSSTEYILHSVVLPAAWYCNPTCVGSLVLGSLSVLGDCLVRGANRGWDELTGWLIKLHASCFCYHCSWWITLTASKI